jgi:hypothetical protein
MSDKKDLQHSGEDAELEREIRIRKFTLTEAIGLTLKVYGCPEDNTRGPSDGGDDIDTAHYMADVRKGQAGAHGLAFRRGNSMRSSLFVCGIILSSLPASAQERQQAGPERLAVKFPLQVSKDRRHLMGQDRLPFLIVGDTAWSLIVDLKEADIKAYLDDRHKRGFNAIVVNLLEHKFATNAPRNRAGLEPFMKTGDFATPNTEYFDFAHRVVGWANERGISVWLAPAYLGWNGGDEGFFQEIKAGGRDKLKAYGKFIGERFKDSANIVWLLGGDYAVPKQHQWAISDLANAIKAGGAKQLMTVHGGQQSAVDVLGDQDWIDINTQNRNVRKRGR